MITKLKSIFGRNYSWNGTISVWEGFFLLFNTSYFSRFYNTDYKYIHVKKQTKLKVFIPLTVTLIFVARLSMIFSTIGDFGVKQTVLV